MVTFISTPIGITQTQIGNPKTIQKLYFGWDRQVQV